MIENNKYNKYLSKNEAKLLENKYASYKTCYVYGTDPDVIFNQTSTEKIFSFSYACFGNLYALFRNKGKSYNEKVEFEVGKPLYMSIVFCLSTRALKSNGSNICVIDDIDDIRRFVNNFNDIINYQADVLIEEDLCRVNITFNSVSEKGLNEMFLLTWIRYLYEIPYCYVALDMLKLSKMEKYSKEDFLNLYTLVSHLSGRGFGLGHACIQYGAFQTRETFAKRLLEKTNLNSLYTTVRTADFLSGLTRPKVGLDLAKCQIFEVKDIFDDEKFEERCKFYERLYDHLVEKSYNQEDGNNT